MLEQYGEWIDEHGRGYSGLRESESHLPASLYESIQSYRQRGGQAYQFQPPQFELPSYEPPEMPSIQEIKPPEFELGLVGYEPTALESDVPRLVPIYRGEEGEIKRARLEGEPPDIYQELGLSQEVSDPYSKFIQSLQSPAASETLPIYDEYGNIVDYQPKEYYEIEGTGLPLFPKKGLPPEMIFLSTPTAPSLSSKAIYGAKLDVAEFRSGGQTAELLGRSLTQGGKKLFFGGESKAYPLVTKFETESPILASKFNINFFKSPTSAKLAGTARGYALGTEKGGVTLGTIQKRSLFFKPSVEFAEIYGQKSLGESIYATLGEQLQQRIINPRLAATSSAGILRVETRPAIAGIGSETSFFKPSGITGRGSQLDIFSGTLKAQTQPAISRGISFLSEPSPIVKQLPKSAGLISTRTQTQPVPLNWMGVYDVTPEAEPSFPSGKIIQPTQKAISRVLKKEYNSYLNNFRERQQREISPFFNLGTREISLLGMQTKQSLRELGRTKLKQTTALTTRQGARQATDLFFKSGMGLGTASLFRAVQQTRQRTGTGARITPSPFITVPTLIPPPIIPKKPEPSESIFWQAKTKKQRLVPGFLVETRRRGKWFPITKKPVGRGLGEWLGVSRTRKTLAASYRLVPTKSLVKPSRFWSYRAPKTMFRAPKSKKETPFTRIQKRKYRLGTKSEIKEIQFWKSKKKKRKRK